MRRAAAVLAGATASIALAGVALAPPASKPSQADGQLPDRRLTPGQVDPKLTADYLCHHSTSERRRVSDSRKRAIFAAYGYPYPGVSEREQWEVDHLIPLSLGGTNDNTNLWPERPYQDKDRLETALRTRVCNGTLDLRTAQQAISTDWRAAYQSYVTAR